jgi:hypothetical protein
MQVDQNGELGKEGRERERDIAEWGENGDEERRWRGF